MNDEVRRHLSDAERYERLSKIFLIISCVSGALGILLMFFGL